MAKSSGVKGWFARRLGRGGPVIPVVRLHGVIAADQRAGRINVQSVTPLLTQAFEMKGDTVALIVNSPGGSPVQSRLIAKLIRDLAAEHKKHVLVFVEDAAASGGYFIATAGDEIIADPSSIVGSIGVIFAGFGFTGALEKLGIERRVHTAGKNKSTLDPFSPEKPEDVERIKQMELDVHQVFIDWVKAHRVGKLKAADDALFTGEFWSGVRGLELGLVDALGDLHETLRARFGDEVRTRIIAPKRGWFQLPRLGLAADLAAAIEDRAAWTRFGLLGTRHRHDLCADPPRRHPADRWCHLAGRPPHLARLDQTVPRGRQGHPRARPRRAQAPRRHHPQARQGRHLPPAGRPLAQPLAASVARTFTNRSARCDAFWSSLL